MAMQIIRDFRRFKPEGNSVVTIGNFDGVHLGHRAVIQRVVKRAAALNCRSVVVTFSPHTQSFLSVGRSCHILSTPEEKAKLMQALNVDALLVLRFDRKLQAMEAGTFLKEVIFRHLKPEEIIFGHDHRFGAGRGGNEETMEAFCRKNGVKSYRMPAFRHEGQVVSSTLIRELMSIGKVEAATELLGGPYLICGRVVKGRGLGRTLGFPTANVETGAGKLLMPDGVYEGTGEAGGREYPAFISLGTRPTFGEGGRALEAHLKGFSGDLYGKRVCLKVAGFKRPLKKCRNTGELKKMIRKDIEQLA